MNSIYIPRVNSGSLAAISSTRTSGLRGSWWFDHRAVEIKTAIVPSLRTRRPRLLYAEDSGRVCAPKDRQVGMQVGTHCHSNLFYHVLSRPNDSEKKWNLSLPPRDSCRRRGSCYTRETALEIVCVGRRLCLHAKETGERPTSAAPDA